MKHSKLKWSMLVLMLASIMVLGACKKKVQPPPPPPPPPPPQPTATLTANPTSIQKGQSATLTWQTQNATDATLNDAKVDVNGSQSVTPDDSTTYRLLAKGPGGEADATARVTVTQPPPPPPPPPPAFDPAKAFNENIKDVYFDFDKYDIRPDQQATVQADASFLKQHPDIKFTIEGHCDERGSTEYNLALGDNRANAVKNVLVQGGVPADSIKTISYGKEKPVCTESNETCWQQNRRGHLVYGMQ